MLPAFFSLPVFETHHDPLRNILVEFRIEDGFLEPRQRSISVHQTAPHEHVAVALEVIARGSRLQRGDFVVEKCLPFF